MVRPKKALASFGCCAIFGPLNWIFAPQCELFLCKFQVRDMGWPQKRVHKEDRTYVSRCSLEFTLQDQIMEGEKRKAGDCSSSDSSKRSRIASDAG